VSKITKEQRQHLLDTHRKGGIAASAPLARELGVESKYGQKLAHRAKDRPSRPSRRTDHNDPRWAWAIERGSVSI